MEFKHQRLDNGLEVLAEVNPEAFSSAIGYFVKTGSRDETPATAGVSHFLEHMMFKGTLRRTAEQVNQDLDELGSQSNAYTSEEQTVYYMTVLPELQAQAVDLLTDMMRPALRDEDFETERNVILEEIAMYDDQPPYGAMERLMEEYFGDHPLALRVLGTAATVRDLKTSEMRAYHERRYAADNLCLVAAGNVDFDRLVEQAARLTENWKPTGQTRNLVLPKLRRGAVQLVHEPATQQYTLQYASGPTREDRMKFANRVMASVLGDDSGSRLFWELVDTGDAETAVAFTHEYQECGLIGLYLACAPEQTAENWEQIRKVLQNAVKEKMTEKERTQAVNKICSGIALSAERPGNRLFTVGNAWTLRNQYESVAEVVAQYQGVTIEKMEAALDAWLKQPTVTISVGPSHRAEIDHCIQ